MLGRSIYLSATEENRNIALAALKPGDWVFISLHSFEDFVDDFQNKAFGLVDEITTRGAQVVADVSPAGVQNLGYASLVDLAKSGKIGALRLDFGFTTEEMFQASKYCKIVLNGSVLDKDLILQLQEAGASIVGMHNFYPREETGLDESFVLESNNYMHAHSTEVWSFSAGDGILREPVFARLPTVEAYRNMHPYVQYELLRRKLKSDVVFIGDTSLKPETENLIRKADEHNAIILPLENPDALPQHLVGSLLTVRHDSNSLVSRIEESRSNTQTEEDIPACNCSERTPGSITRDNNNYGRYAGEIQIIRTKLAADNRVNILTQIKEPFKPLLQLLTGDTKVYFPPKVV